MSGGGRHDERGGALEPTAGDDLLDLLYGELDGEAERAMRARVAADPALADQLGQFERVRGLFRELADEEPPARSTAQLLAQAAQARKGESEGFWQRVRGWLTPIVAHPGLAAAASLILVAGVAGLLLLRKGTELTRVRSEPTALDIEAAPAAPTATPAEERPVEIGGSAASAPAPASAPAGDDDLAAEAPARAAESRPSRRRAKARAEKEQAAGGKDTAASPVLGYSKEGLPAATPGSTSADEGGLEEQAEGEMSHDPASPASNAPAGKPSPSPADPPPDQSKVPSAPPAPSPAKPEPGKLGSPADLHKQALEAASNRQCLQVQSLAQSVRRADPAYYDKVFRPDRRLAVCLSTGKRTKGE